jgi:hypothetical protein
MGETLTSIALPVSENSVLRWIIKDEKQHLISVCLLYHYHGRNSKSAGSVWFTLCFRKDSKLEHSKLFNEELRMTKKYFVLHVYKGLFHSTGFS